MVIRRIRQHVTRHDWFAVGVDFAIVVAGVFLGIQVSNWNEARIQLDKARDYRVRLAEEVEFNRLQYRQQLAYYNNVRRHALAARSALQRAPGPGDAALAVDAYQATQLDIYPAKRFIYDEMLAAGMVASIGGDDVQEAASAFYLGVEAVNAALSKEPPYRLLARKAVPYPVQQQIRARCGDRLVEVRGRIVGIAMPDVCAPGIAPRRAADAARRIRNHPEVEAELNGHLAALDQKIGLLHLIIGQSEQLLGSLRAR